MPTGTNPRTYAAVQHKASVAFGSIEIKFYFAGSMALFGG